MESAPYLVGGEAPYLLGSPIAVGANPTATVSGTAVNGVATTFMRSDAAPALANTTVAAGSYTYASLTVDAQGRLTASSSGTTPVTSITAGAGLTGGTITTTGTIALASPIAASFMPAYTGDVTSPAGSTVNTLPNVNTNIGTYNNIAINAKGLATAGSNVAYLTGNQTITLGGDLSGSGTTAITGTVTGLQGHAVSATAPSATNQVLQWSGTAWTPTVAAGGSVTSITQGTGMAFSVSPITTTGTINIATGGVSNALLANMAANTLKGNNTGAAAAPLDLTVTQTMTLLGAAPLASPVFTGTPQAPTPGAGTSNTFLATTAFVATSFAPLASPSFTGTVTNSGEILSTGASAGQGFADRTSGLQWQWYANGGQASLYNPTNGGVFAVDLGGNVNVGGGLVVGSPTGGNKGVGTVNASAVYANGTALTSDRRSKRDIEPLPDGCLELVEAIVPKTFRHVPASAEAEGDGGAGFWERRNWGFIAQEVGEVMERAGHDFGGHIDDGGVQSLSYNDLIALLWRGTQELIARVAVLEAQIGAAGK